MKSLKQHLHQKNKNKNKGGNGSAIYSGTTVSVDDPAVDPATGDLRMGNEMDIGWMQNIILSAAEARAIAYPISSRTEIIVAQGYPIYLTASSGNQIIAACKIAAQGSGNKAVATALMASPPVDTTLDLTTIQSFGVRVKIADSLNNFKYGIYDVQLLDGATVLSEVFVRAATNVVDFIMFGISNIGSQASIKPIAHPEVKVLAASSSLAAGNSFTAETLNERDLGLSLTDSANLC